MLVPELLMLKSSELRVESVASDAISYVGDLVQVQFNDEMSLGQTTYQRVVDGISITASAPIPAPVIDDPRAQFDDTSLRLSPYNAPLVQHSERLIVTLQDEIRKVGKVIVRGPAATDHFALCAIINACARLGSHQPIRLIFDQNTFQVPTNNGRTREAYRKRFLAITRSMAHMSQTGESSIEMPENPIVARRTPNIHPDTLLGNELGILALEEPSDTALIAQAIAMARSGSIPHVQHVAKVIRMKPGSAAQRALRHARAASLECLALVKIGGTASHLNQAEKITQLGLRILEKTSTTGEEGIALAASLHNHLALISVKRAILERNKTLFRSAQAHLRTAIRLAAQTTSSDQCGLRFNLLNNCAKLYEGETRFQEALEIIESDFQCADSAPAQYRRSVLLSKMGDTDRAVGALDLAWDLVPNIHWAWKETILRARAALSNKRGDRDGAIRNLEIGMQLANRVGAFRRSLVNARALLDALGDHGCFARHPQVRELQARSPDLPVDSMLPLAISMPPKLPPYVPEMDLWDLTGPSVDDGISQLMRRYERAA